MQEIKLRKIHRYLGLIAAPLVVAQASSGLMLSLDVLSRWQHRVRILLEDVDLPALARFWDTVLYQIHFGSGKLGLLHNVAVGSSLLLLAVTGIFIFVRVFARTHFQPSPRPQAEPAPVATPEEVPGEPETVPRWQVGLALGAAAMGLMALDIYMFAAAYRVSGLHVPHLYAATEVEVYAARSRTALEQVLAGDPKGSIDRAWASLESAETSARELLEGAKDTGPRGKAFRVLPVENLPIRRRIEGVLQGVRSLKDLTIQRFMAAAPPGQGGSLEVAYGRAFEGTQASARGVVETLMQTVAKDRASLFAIHLVLFSAAFLFVVAVGAVLYAYEASRARHLHSVRTARDMARAYQARFRAVIRQAADPLVVFDQEGQVVEASLSAGRLLGYEEEELRSQQAGTIDTRTPPAEREALWGELVPGAPIAAKADWVRRDGSEVPVVLSLALVADGESAGHPLVLVHARPADARPASEGTGREEGDGGNG